MANETEIKYLTPIAVETQRKKCCPHLGVHVTVGAARAQVHEMPVRARRADRGDRRGGDDGSVLEDRPVDVDEHDARGLRERTSAR